MKLIFIDIETTGLNFDIHVPIDIAISILDCATQQVTNYTSLITIDAFDWLVADPEALNVNGYTQEKHIDSQDSWIVGREIELLFLENKIVNKESVFICQNPSFDRYFFHRLISNDRMNELNMPYHWLDLASMYWMKYFGSCYSIPHELSLSKDSIAHAMGLPPEIKPHKAQNGVKHLMLCYTNMCAFNKFINLPDLRQMPIF